MPPRPKSPGRPKKTAAPSAAKTPARRDSLADFSKYDRKVRPPKAVPAPVPPTDSHAQSRFDDLREVAMSLGTAVDLREILDRIVDGILRVAGCERGLVFLAQEGGEFETYTGRQRGGAWNEEDLRQISGTIVDQVAVSHKPFIAANLQEFDDLKARGSIHDGKILSAVCLPLLYEDRLVGVIYADSRHVTPPYRDTDRGVLLLFAVQAALAIENAQRHGELRTRGDRLEEQNLTLARQLAHEFRMAGTVAKSKPMMEVFESIARVAPADHINVLIEGESGTGKEGLAHAIHDRSPRRDRPFVALNCAGMSETLVVDTLFGHVKGAFSGADSDRMGHIEAAHGGTLFLDEIGEMPFDMQPKLLRALEQGVVTRVGDVTERPVDVRIVSATNLDLERAVEDGVFRQDLFYRLRGTQINVPPLRDRPDDIIPLAEYFLDLYAKEKKKPRPQLSHGARAALLANPWQGNVRELKKAIDAAILYADEDHVIHAKAIGRDAMGRKSAAAGPAQFKGTLRSQMDRFEEAVIRAALAEHEFKVANAAKMLDLSRQQLYAKIHKYNISLRSE